MDAGEPKSKSYTTLGLAVLGGVLLWASLPPLGLSWLGWIAPVPWLWLARLPVLPGRRPYWALWCGGAVFWVATNHWLRLPHPATSLGWLALSLYLACFTPLIVGLARVAARWKVGIVVSGPVLWVAADQARAYIFTGFSMSSLCHSQSRTWWAIQTADLWGEFGVTFLMVMFAAGIARALPTPDYSRSPRWILASLGVAMAMAGYSLICFDIIKPQDYPPCKLALIQGSIESEVKHDPDKTPVVYEHYSKLTQEAVAVAPDVQLVVWPETMFPYPYLKVTDDARPKPGDEWSIDVLRRNADFFNSMIVNTARRFHKPLLLGIASAEFGNGFEKDFNSALLVDAEGKPLGRYDKQHRVIFGEYIPLADWFPWLYAMTPLTGGIEGGARAEAFEIDGVRLAPSVCYETTLSRVILRQVAELRDRGEEPDVLVNVTNDGWFRGSSELDLHLACGVFRAVEMRKPLVIAANTGFSASIDRWGVIQAQGPRRSEGYVIAEVIANRNLRSPFLTSGNWLAWACLLAACITAMTGLWVRRQPHRAAALS